MMKRILLAAASLFAAALFASAQQPDIEAHLKAHPELLAGTDYLCPTGPVTLTKRDTRVSRRPPTKTSRVLLQRVSRP